MSLKLLSAMIRREGHLYCFHVFVCDRFITASVTSHSNGRELRVTCANLQGTPQSFEQETSGIRLKARQILRYIANLIISV